MMNPKIQTVCLFEETVTAASAAMKVFQRNHLAVERPIVLDARPSASRNSSIVSQKYLAWLGNANKVDIASSGTTGERKIGKFSMDGFVEPCPKFPRGLVIELFGCYWHAHECRYTNQSIIGGLTTEAIRKLDEERLQFLRERHEVKVVWECKVEKPRSKNPVMAKLFEEYEPIGLMEMEKALSGGRTEAFRLMADDSRWIMKHVDVVSMYPAVRNVDFNFSEVFL
ncbi:hypothetical protein GCK72_008669 [Caenorhabditis remanei]|uniref:DNA-directed DNA polymerase n=1 Tax=Caenorhabditis remanei TaxID=31234 RepID=A0A6A5GY61_CAERE|nr:hypothetical protein GCK72_008669 [Caenorhabditis remanei]KAF1760420.1 hypothetical protein GCK72_008669 [Caenorhabditis remanei]